MNPFTWIKNHSLFHDRRAVFLLAVSFILAMAVVILSVLSIESRSFKVPASYSGYFAGRLGDRQEWYLLYAFPLFAIITLVINSVLALRVHKIRPELSRAILVMHWVVAVITYLVSGAVFGLL